MSSTADQIEELVALAGPLRLLSEAEQADSGLREIVDRINALRALKVEAVEALDVAVTESHGAEFAQVVDSLKRKPGRPVKAI